MSSLARPDSSLSRRQVAFAVVHVVFLTMGIGLLGYAFYLGTRGTEGATLWVTAAAGVLGVAISVRNLRRLFRSAPEEEEAPNPFADEPWRVRPEWRGTEMEEETGNAWASLGFAGLWNAFTFPVAGYIVYDVTTSPNPEWGALFVLLFPAVGLFLLWTGIKPFLVRRKYGTTTLRMEQVPFRLGDRFTAWARTGLDATHVPEDGVKAVLSCYRRKVRYTTDSDGDRKRTVDLDLLWRDEKAVRGRGYGAQNRLEVPVSFQLPTDQPPSTAEPLDNRILWRLELSADVAGLDFEASFEVPVFAPEGGIPETAEDPEAAAADDPYDHYEVGGDFHKPVSSGISVARTPGGGLEVKVGAARQKGMAAIVTAVALASTVGSVFALITFHLFVFLIVGLFALVFGYLSWQLWTERITVTVADGTLSVRTERLGWSQTETIPCGELIDVRAEVSGRSGSSAYYDLNAYRDDPAYPDEAVSGARKIGEIAEALGAADATRDELLQTVRERAETNGRKVKLAGYLTNKQEADWMAERILRAAEREVTFG